MAESRIITTEEGRSALLALIRHKAVPFTISIREGKHRTNPQNRLQHKWYVEAAEQIGDYDAGEYKRRCKLRFGVPILRGSDEGFNELWGRTAAKQDYETQVELMEYFSVTSLMTTKEKKQYLDAVQKFLTERGVVLTDPEARL